MFEDYNNLKFARFFPMGDANAPRYVPVIILILHIPCKNAFTRTKYKCTRIYFTHDRRFANPNINTLSSSLFKLNFTNLYRRLRLHVSVMTLSGKYIKYELKMVYYGNNLDTETNLNFDIKRLLL